MSARAAAASALAHRLGHTFCEPSRLEQALTHASVGDGSRRVRDNEQLEFLGDRVLGLLTAERLIETDPDASEGDLAPRFNALVNRDTCASVARRMELGPAMRLSGGETRSGGRDKDRILADAVEAVIAAVFVDGGLDAARIVYDRFWTPEFERLQTTRPKDPKTALQEWAQGRGDPLPTYVVVTREGVEHAPRFTVAAMVSSYAPALGEGSSRQAAEKDAASNLLARETGMVTI